MKKTFACCLLVSIFSCTNPPGNTDKKTLVWSDEFNYTGLPDSSKWNYDTGGDGWGNNELEYYTANRAENARVENGNLVIEARKEDWDSSHYTSARLVTRGKAGWQYGRMEIRAKLPSGLGTWPAIWTLASTTPFNWPDDGEIDIMEHVGYDPGRIHGSIHCKQFNHVIGTQKTANIEIPDYSDSFHMYYLDWNKDSIKIGADNTTYFRFANDHAGYGSWPFDNKMYLILNIAVGGNWGGQKGLDTTIWPKQMLVDYVRVYQ